MKRLLDAKDLAVTQACVTALLFLLIPLFNLLDMGSYRLSSVLHGLGATLTIIFSSRTAHLVFPLLRNQKGAGSKLEMYLWMMNALVLLSIIFGNWLYIAYRTPDGAQQWFLYHNPSVHMVVMEFKEFISLFPLPLGVAAAYILRRFSNQLTDNPAIASIVALLVTLAWICLLIGFVFGIGLVKLKAA